MFSVAAAELLHDTYGQDAVHVGEVGFRAADDTQVAATARAESRAVVTENAAGFAAERDVVLVFVLKRNLPAGGRASCGPGEDPGPMGPGFPGSIPSAPLTENRLISFATSRRLQRSHERNRS